MTPNSVPSFGLLRQPRIILTGIGQRHALAGVLSPLAKHVLICTDARVATQLYLTEIVHQLKNSDRTVVVYSDIQPELPVATVNQAYEGLRDQSFDVVVGIGGGSCLDFAKVMAMLLQHGGIPSDYYGEMAVPGPTLPVVAIPTTAGTGSEVTPVAVLTDSERGTKVGISSPYLIPDIALCDPELTYSAPASLTAATGADALSHLVESYTAIRRPTTPQLVSERVFVGKSDLTDRFAEMGLAAVGRSLIRAVLQPDASARGDMSTAALCGGLALGTAGTAAAHALQYPVGAMTHTPHGVGVGCLLPYVMEFNRPARVAEFAMIARILDPSLTGNDEELSFAAVDQVSTILDAIEIPRTLGDLGLDVSDARSIADAALLMTRLVENNPVHLDAASLELIAFAAITGQRERLRSVAAV